MRRGFHRQSRFADLRQELDVPRLARPQLHHRMFMGYGAAAAFVVDAADFDGTNDYMTTGAALSGQAASKQGIFSCWFRMDNTGGDLLIGADLGADWEVFRARASSTQIIVAGNNVTSADGFNIVANMTVNTATWYHLLASWDISASSTTHLYVNDVSEKDSATTPNLSTEYNLIDNWTAGAYEQDVAFGGGNLWDGCLAEIYFAPGQYLDFSVEANRRKFISATGKPVSLGSSGSTPTGSTPLIYLHLDDAESVSNFATNRAGTGNFSITGALATCASSPS
jgi:hypothetical protein